jgi:hypothetical protein
VICFIHWGSGLRDSGKLGYFQNVASCFAYWCQGEDLKFSWGGCLDQRNSFIMDNEGRLNYGEMRARLGRFLGGAGGWSFGALVLSADLSSAGSVHCRARDWALDLPSPGLPWDDLPSALLGAAIRGSGWQVEGAGTCRGRGCSPPPAAQDSRSSWDQQRSLGHLALCHSTEFWDGSCPAGRAQGGSTFFPRSLGCSFGPDRHRRVSHRSSLPRLHACLPWWTLPESFLNLPQNDRRSNYCKRLTLLFRVLGGVLTAHPVFFSRFRYISMCPAHMLNSNIFLCSLFSLWYWLLAVLQVQFGLWVFAPQVLGPGDQWKVCHIVEFAWLVLSVWVLCFPDYCITGMVAVLQASLPILGESFLCPLDPYLPHGELWTGVSCG